MTIEQNAALNWDLCSAAIERSQERDDPPVDVEPAEDIMSEDDISDAFAQSEDATLRELLEDAHTDALKEDSLYSKCMTIAEEAIAWAQLCPMHSPLPVSAFI